VTRHGPVDGSEWGGLLPNLFSTHPPFQIDGNLGFPAGIAELLIQSHGDVVRLLPALPSGWRTGDVQGLGARAGLVVDLAWHDGALTGARVSDTLRRDRRVVVEYAGIRIDVPLGAGSSAELTPGDFTDAASLALGGRHAR
jgi:alpha-L-fucosidase 2